MTRNVILVLLAGWVGEGDQAACDLAYEKVAEGLKAILTRPSWPPLP